MPKESLKSLAVPTSHSRTLLSGLRPQDEIHDVGLAVEQAVQNYPKHDARVTAPALAAADGHTAAVGAQSHEPALTPLTCELFFEFKLVTTGLVQDFPKFQVYLYL